MSATMGFNKIAELTHEMEDVLDLIRKEQIKLTEDIVDTLFKCLDSLEQMVDNVGNGDPEDLIDVSDLVAKLSSISKGGGAPAPAADAPATPAAGAAAPAPAAAAEPSAAELALQLNDTDKSMIRQAKEGGMQGVHIQVTLSDTCLLKSARSYMVMNALDELGDVIKTVPPAEELEQEKFEQSFDILMVSGSEPKAVEDALSTISEIDKILVELVDPDAAPAPAAPAAPAAAAAAALQARPASPVRVPWAAS
jgi:two-component system chemotaxis sensor kinase CheA